MTRPVHQVATFTITCPACEQLVEIPVFVDSIETRGLSLVDVRLHAAVHHPCKEAP